jgi:hypothetical protein
MRGPVRALSLTATLALAACGGPPAPAAPAVEAPSAGEAAAVEGNDLTRLEARLLASERLHLTASIHTEGALDASFDGELLLAPPHRARLSFRGLLGEAERNPWFESSPEGFGGGTDGRVFRGPSTGPTVDRWVRLLTRRGLAVALTDLAAGRLPDLDAQDLRVDDVEERDAVDADGMPLRHLTFRLDDAEGHLADVELFFDGATPIERRQVQRLPGGRSVRIVERYLDVRFGEAVDEVELRPSHLLRAPAE